MRSSRFCGMRASLRQRGICVIRLYAAINRRSSTSVPRDQETRALSQYRFILALDSCGESAMKRETRFYLVVVCGIVLFDVVASFASRALKFDYTHLAWASWFLYALAGYFGFGYSRLAGALLAGLVAGIADAT